MRFWLTLKDLFGLALHQTMGFVQSLLQLSGLGLPASDLSSEFLCSHPQSVH
ncbi:transposase [Comamonas sp.]|uniref:transposase n=1 Tax=Comamonas sp. TaxID=34028 RepID=UPI003FA5D8B1